jgi:thiol-disulfide isomerase/thioredoxin
MSRRSAVLLASLLLSVTGVVIAAIPQFSFPDLTGDPHSIDEYVGHGKWTIVNVLGTGCSSCLVELPELVRFQEEHHDSDATVLGLALDYPSFGDADVVDVMALVDSYEINFPVLLGKKRKIERLGGGPLAGMPTTYIFHPGGELVAVQVGAITAARIESFISNYPAQ